MLQVSGKRAAEEERRGGGTEHGAAGWDSRRGQNLEKPPTLEEDNGGGRGEEELLTAGRGGPQPPAPRNLPAGGVHTPALPPLLALGGAERPSTFTGRDEHAGRLHGDPTLLLTGGGA